MRRDISDAERMDWRQAIKLAQYAVALQRGMSLTRGVASWAWAKALREVGRA